MRTIFEGQAIGMPRILPRVAKHGMGRSYTRTLATPLVHARHWQIGVWKAGKGVCGASRAERAASKPYAEQLITQFLRPACREDGVCVELHKA